MKALGKIRYSLGFPRMQTIGKDLYLSSVRNMFGKSARLVPATLLACGWRGAGGGGVRGLKARQEKHDLQESLNHACSY